MKSSTTDLRSERVLILGGSGWVGSAASRILSNSGAEILEMASYQRDVISEWGIRKIVATDYEVARAFEPTMVIDAAFITRERISEVGEKAFIETNLRLIEFAQRIQELPTIKSFIGLSSGAAVFHPQDENNLTVPEMYGKMKRDYENSLLDSSLRDKTKIARIWSVTCPFVTKLSFFAFADLIIQGRKGEIQINSTGEVWRRYVDLGEFIEVVIAASPEEDRVIDSGGELIEIGELAEIVFEVLGMAARVVRNLVPSAPRNDFYSDNLSWSKAVRQIDFTPKTIKQQLADVAQRLPR
jgi:nucleoside-diphosphate-sugar epimerase